MQSESLSQRAVLAYDAFLVKGGSSLQSIFLLAVRLYWGWQFAQTGWGKIQHLPKVTNFFMSLGIPAPGFSAFAVSWLELIGGIGLALGIGSRFWGFLLAGDMVVAYLTAGRQDLLNFFSDPGKFYGDDAFTFLLASALVFIFGPGRFALDLLLRRTLATGAADSSLPSARVGAPAGSVTQPLT